VRSSCGGERSGGNRGQEGRVPVSTCPSASHALVDARLTCAGLRPQQLAVAPRDARPPDSGSGWGWAPRDPRGRAWTGKTCFESCRSSSTISTSQRI